MSEPMRLLDTGPMSARRNVAIAAALAELHRAGQSPDTLRLCVYPRAVLVGSDQRPTDVVRVKACRRYHIEIAHRMTDGVAVYMSPGILAWDVVTERHRFGNRLGEVSERICSGLAAGLARFGLPARFRPFDEVEIGGRRISQSHGWVDGPTAVFQGAVLIDIDLVDMDTILRSPAARSSLITPVTSLAEWLGRVPPMDEVKRLLIAGLAHSWHCEFRPGSLAPPELKLADRLLDEGFATESFADAPVAAAAAAERRAATSARMGVRAP